VRWRWQNNTAMDFPLGSDTDLASLCADQDASIGIQTVDVSRVRSLSQPTGSYTADVDQPSVRSLRVRHMDGVADFRLAEIDVPSIGEDEILVEVHACAIDRDDLWRSVKRRLPASPAPQFQALGADVAGRVAAIGNAVRKLRVGDRVAGCLPHASDTGGCTEYVSVRESRFARIPGELGYESAAALISAGRAALRCADHCRAGDRVLINNAATPTGLLTALVALMRGAQTSLVCGPADFQLLVERYPRIVEARLLDSVEAAHDSSVDVLVDVNCDLSSRTKRSKMSGQGIAFAVNGARLSVAFDQSVYPLVDDVSSSCLEKVFSFASSQGLLSPLTLVVPIEEAGTVLSVMHHSMPLWKLVVQITRSPRLDRQLKQSRGATNRLSTSEQRAGLFH
jgi:NADPH:quinone reductase-like Zn-dependent oxidoreductase